MLSSDAQVWVVFAVIAFLIVSLYKEFFKPAFTFMLVTVLFVALEILTPTEALAGFANEQLAVIVLLLVLGNIFSKTTVVDSLFGAVFKNNNSPKSFLAKMMSGVGVSSAAVNNTPLVAMLMPYVYSWSKKNKYSPSKFLIPLSYASILGGCVTLIGTSTNLIANGLAVESGEASLGIFDFAWVGLPMLVIGLAYLYFFSDKMLPGSTSVTEQLLTNQREYFLETHVKQQSPLIGKSVEDADLRNMSGLFLVEILRGEKIISPVAPTEILEQDDVLFFAGNPESIAELTKPKMGLSLPKFCDIPLQEQNDIVEIVVSHNSQLVGKKVRDSNFRGKYDGAILAIHRNGEKLWGKIGELTLQAGDVLLVLAGRDFMKRIQDSPAFYLISRAKEIHNVDKRKVAVLSIGFLTAIGLAAFEVTPLFVSLSILFVLTLLMKIAKPIEIRNSIDYSLILIIVFGLALGKAMIKSGAADMLGDAFLKMETLSPVIIIALIFIITNVLSAFMTSKAAVAIVLPIALSISHSLNVEAAPFIMVVAFGGAANFITPIGYQTNLMVYGPGGYSFKDFFKIGLPLTLTYLVVCTLILSWVYNLY
jgi:di/tricarboxylate transporter